MDIEKSTVESIGVNEKGDSVIRIRLARGAQIEVSTNVLGFAKLAAAGVFVKNDYQRQAPRG
jgi:hypothetical protein